MPLTIDQLAQRATKKRNNKLRKELPLLATALQPGGQLESWLTTEEAQKERIERQHQNFNEWWKQFENQQEENRMLAERMKAEVRELVDDEERFGVLVRGMRHIEHCGAEYHLDYWHRVLARLDPKYCPHYQNGHQVSRALGHDTCPVCGASLGNKQKR